MHKEKSSTFLGDALSWLTGTAKTKDVSSIKKRVNQLIAIQHNQQETLVHVISIVSITRYATQVNRQHINIVINGERTHQDVTTLQHHTFTVQQPELPADCTSHLLHSSKPQRFPILYERSHHTYNGLH